MRTLHGEEKRSDHATLILIMGELPRRLHKGPGGAKCVNDGKLDRRRKRRHELKQATRVCSHLILDKDLVAGKR